MDSCICSEGVRFLEAAVRRGLWVHGAEDDLVAIGDFQLDRGDEGFVLILLVGFVHSGESP
jgi:hypothetical protein